MKRITVLVDKSEGITRWVDRNYPDGASVVWGGEDLKGYDVCIFSGLYTTSLNVPNRALVYIAADATRETRILATKLKKSGIPVVRISV